MNNVQIDKKDTIVVLQERMMGWLCFNRFHCIKIKPDLKDPSRRAYIFEDTTQLRNAMKKYNEFKDLVNQL